ncbi:DUF2806 domain-containing protein [Ensifer sp. 1H6]|uniref:DUF2806 domain-containing protein n=1 Tax=Ensifer sp. 1H6 TaxID=1911585 RepID=UPI0009D1CBF1|nr:DUF2806 domain-containing protein [Ensifer sp. 1H6]OMQ44917.1 hypothetical protein BKP54_11020 [Ensifer sp. 1H6]
MSEDSSELPSSSSWAGVLSTLLEGGLPQVIAGPAGKSISRLISGFTEIPAAWLKMQARSIADETESKSIVAKAVAEAAARSASSNPEIVERAVDRFVGDLTRKQRNREDVARRTVEYLRIDPPPLDCDGPTDDWMNSFERYAEDASSDEFRDLWAKILAGEIRRRGSYSPRTMQVVSSLDDGMAKLIEKALKYAVNTSLPVAAIENALEFEESFALQDFGLFAIHGPGTDFFFNVQEDGYAYVFSDQFVYRVKLSKENERSAFNTYVLTRVGKEIAATLQVKVDPRAISKALWSSKPRPLEIHYASVLAHQGEDFRVGEWISGAEQ